MKRREFLITTLGAGLLTTIDKCSSPVSSETPKPDIVLEEDEEQISETINSSKEKLKKLASGEKENLIIETHGENQKTLEMNLEGEGASKYISIKDKEENERVNVLGTSKNGQPAVKLTNENGEVVKKNNNEAIVSTSEAIGDFGDILPGEWWKLGAKIFAAGLAIWLGAKIAGLFVSAIGFLAFSALVLGAVMFGIDIALGIVDFIIDKTGLDKEKIEKFFNEILKELESILNEITDFAKQY